MGERTDPDGERRWRADTRLTASQSYAANRSAGHFTFHMGTNLSYTPSHVLLNPIIIAKFGEYNKRPDMRRLMDKKQQQRDELNKLYNTRANLRLKYISIGIMAVGIAIMLAIII